MNNPKLQRKEKEITPEQIPLFPKGKVFLRKKDVQSVDTRENNINIKTDQGQQFLLSSEDQLSFLDKE